VKTFRELFGLWQTYEDEFDRLSAWMDGTEADMGDLLMRDDLGERQEELVEDTQVGRDRDMIYLLDQNIYF